MNLSNFGEQFASKVLAKVYATMVTDSISNRDYERELKGPGDRVNILSFLNEAELGDYAVGSDMTVAQVVDAEDQLIAEKRKYYNFSLDRLEDLFTYADNIPDTLIEQHAQKLSETIDTYVLDAAGTDVKAGNWIGVNFLVTGSTQGTEASLVTTATGGTITIIADRPATDSSSQVPGIENPLDGVVYFGGFQSIDLYKGIRLVSTRSLVSPWYRISGVTSSVVVTVTEWDEAVSGPDFAENYTLRGVFGGDGITFPKYGGSPGADVPFAGNAAGGFGWEVQAAIATSVSASTIYDQATLLAERLDDGNIPMSDRTFTLNPAGLTALRQAAELQPTGIGELYKEVVLNGKAGRIGSFDVHMATGARVSFRAGKSTAASIDPTVDPTAGNRGNLFVANHKGWVTFAEKWSESRVVDAENQFAKKYQGLMVFGKKVPRERRKFAAVLFGSQ